MRKGKEDTSITFLFKGGLSNAGFLFKVEFGRTGAGSCEGTLFISLNFADLKSLSGVALGLSWFILVSLQCKIK